MKKYKSQCKHETNTEKVLGTEWMMHKYNESWKLKKRDWFSCKLKIGKYFTFTKELQTEFQVDSQRCQIKNE